MSKKEAAHDKPVEPIVEQPQQEDYLDQLIHLKADFENYRKRVDREKPELIAYGKHQMLLKLLPLYETILKAKSHLEQNKDAAKDAELYKGMELIFKEFDKMFAAEGVEPMETIGKPYDPMCHDVLAALDCPADKDGLVIEEAAKGFHCGGKVLLPAKVCIGKSKEIAAKEEVAEQEGEK